IVGHTPLSDGLVRSAEARIRSQVRRRCHRARGCRRAHDLTLLGKQSMKFHPYLKANAAVPINRDMATRLRLLRAHGIPDHTTAFRYHARELGRTRLASDDGERDTAQSLELDGVRRHGGVSLDAATASISTRASRGNRATCTVARAGYGSEK